MDKDTKANRGDQDDATATETGCCAPSEAKACCAPDAKAQCCGVTQAATPEAPLPKKCGCR